MLLYITNLGFFPQKQAGLIRQLEEELRTRGGKNPAVVELQQQLDQFYVENDHLTRENTILKETVKVSSGVEDTNSVLFCKR